MSRSIRILSIVGLIAAASCGGIDEGPETIADLASQLPAEFESIRGERNCEIFEVDLLDGNIVLNVWNNGGQGHECPDEWLASIDRDFYYVDGPRWRPLDLFVTVDDDGSLSTDRSAATAEEVTREIPDGSGITMFKAATVELGPADRISSNFGGPESIKTADDITPLVRRGILDMVAPDLEGDYPITSVDRAIKTFMVFQAGKPVFTLFDGECTYAMKYYTSAVNPALTNEAAVAELANGLQRLPDGFEFRVQVFDEDRYILDLDGEQQVRTDEFGNTYDLMSCESDG